MPQSALKFIKGVTIKIPVYTPWILTGYTITAILRRADRTTAKTFTTSLSTNTTQPTKSGYQVTDSQIMLTLSAADSEELAPDTYEIATKLVAPNTEVATLRATQFVIEED